MPITIHVLGALVESPQSLTDLHRAAGLPPKTTMRNHLRTLAETGVIARRRQSEFPGALNFESTSVGRDLWAVAGVLGAWLQTSPDGPLALGGSPAKSAVKALVDGWGTSMVRALAARPLSLTELSGLISGLSYPSLERRLGAMRLAGQVERASGQSRGRPYGVTDWLRKATAPLGAAARWERAHVAESTAPIRRLDAEAAFLLAIPLLRPPKELAGACRLAVEVPSSQGRRLAGVVVEVRERKVVSCVARIEADADAWATGSSAAWLRAVVEGDAEGLEIGGDRDFARALLEGLHGALFGVPRPG